MNVVYRRADLNDAYGIAYVSAYSWNETYSGLLPDDYLKNRIKSINNKIDTTKKFIKEHPNYLVAETNNMIIGICEYEFGDKEYGRLGALYVLKEYQKIGVGKKLFKMAIEGLLNMGYKKMFLECMVGNDTINFYTKYLGKTEKTIDFYINNVGNVKANIVIFEDLNKTYNELIKVKRM